MPPRCERVIIIVLDGAGIGALPDASLYGDGQADTLGHVWECCGGLDIPNLLCLGLAPLIGIGEYRCGPARARGAWARLIEASAGKDTTTGHWEIAGLITERPHPVFPHGFPPEFIGAFEQRIGRGVLGNLPASGTELLEALGPRHERTGMPIVYTSADSVFQIAAHESIISVEQLYGMCRHARELLTGPWAVARVIARPFTGSAGAYRRTHNRRDFSIAPPRDTILDGVANSGREVVGIGKIEDIFAGRGITRAIHTQDNDHGIRVLLDEMRRRFSGLVFVNLVDFDALYGHRRNAAGFADALESLDRQLPLVVRSMTPEDTLIITADHGNDPTAPGTDHTREAVPCLARGRGFELPVDLGTRTTFADIAATVAQLLEVAWGDTGASLAHQRSAGAIPGRLRSPNTLIRDFGRL